MILIINKCLRIDVLEITVQAKEWFLLYSIGFKLQIYNRALA